MLDSDSAFSMNAGPASGLGAAGTPVSILCHDGILLAGHLWSGVPRPAGGSVIVNPATGVLASYYHRYASFLAEHGFDVLTYDYRGIGRSRPTRLKGCGYRWRDWGELDFDAALRFMDGRDPEGPLLVVGHSVGGFLPGLAAGAGRIERMLTVGAQHGCWHDYAPAQRARLMLKWHLAMPVLTALFGYFPGRRLGWIEDLPAGVANAWSFGGARMAMRLTASERLALVRRFDAVTAQILAIAVTDDPIGTPTAIRRTLAYYRNADALDVLLSPADLGCAQIGHFSLFHDRHRAGFWLDSVLWLRDGVNPWPSQPMRLPKRTE